MSYSSRLYDAVSAVAPVVAVRVGRPDDPHAVDIEFEPDLPSDDPRRAAAIAAAAAVPGAEPPPRKVTPLEWLDRLPVGRQIDVMTAVGTTPAAKLWWTKLQMAVEIDLDSQVTRDGLAYLVARGVLTHDEAAALLA